MLNTVRLQRGDVLWLKIPQTLSPLSAAATEPFKIRPFISLVEKADIKINHKDECMQERPLLGVACTSKHYLVDKRPHLEFQMPGSNTPSYVYLDNVRDINLCGQTVRIAHTVSDPEVDIIQDGLAEIMQPENKFFLKTLVHQFAYAAVPGQIWDIETHDIRGEALILLRRGRLLMSELAEYASGENTAEKDPMLRKFRYVPYLAIHFKKAKGVTSLKGIGWNDVQVVSIQEASLIKKRAEISPDTVGIVLNYIRTQMGIPHIAYAQPTFSSKSNLFSLISRLSFPLRRSP